MTNDPPPFDAVREALAGRRVSYERGRLDEADALHDPLAQFARWLVDASDAGVPEPTAMVLATSSGGIPSARVVLLKGFDERGFAFFSNVRSQKGRELALNPRASLCFPWHGVERQVRISGRTKPMEAEEVAEYFATRPRDSRLGALASRQSEVIESREVIETAYTELETKYEGKEVPVPEDWGGWRVIPWTIEFWQGRAGRMHDRLRYRRSGQHWILERLSP